DIDQRIDESVERAGLYPIDAVSRIVGISAERLRSWDRLGIACSSVIVRGKRFYGFQDLLVVRRVKALVDHGVPTRRIKKALEGLQRCHPSKRRSPSDVRFAVMGKN